MALCPSRESWVRVLLWKCRSSTGRNTSRREGLPLPTSYRWALSQQHTCRKYSHDFYFHVQNMCVLCACTSGWVILWRAVSCCLPRLHGVSTLQMLSTHISRPPGISMTVCCRPSGKYATKPSVEMLICAVRVQLALCVTDMTDRWLCLFEVMISKRRGSKYPKYFRISQTDL